MKHECGLKEQTAASKVILSCFILNCQLECKKQGNQTLANFGIHLHHGRFNLLITLHNLLK